jgi:NADH:ubiquinone oxidoreductase subunit 3 (subunit A)
MSKIKKTIAILLAVLFLVSLTASAVSAKRSWDNQKNVVASGAVIASVIQLSKSYDSGINKIGSSSTDNPLNYLLNILKNVYERSVGNSGSSDDNSKMSIMDKRIAVIG